MNKKNSNNFELYLYSLEIFIIFVDVDIWGNGSKVDGIFNMKKKMRCYFRVVDYKIIEGFLNVN